MRKFLFPRIHGPDHDLCIRSMLKSVVREGGGCRSRFTAGRGCGSRFTAVGRVFHISRVL